MSYIAVEADAYMQYLAGTGLAGGDQPDESHATNICRPCGRIIPDLQSGSLVIQIQFGILQSQTNIN